MNPMHTNNPPDPMNLEKIPATVVTGFLGSGKTTLLANLIKQAAGKRLAIIVNEFGELDIDAELLRCPLDCAEPAAEAAADGIYELANGCICCTVEEEFLPVMRQLLARRDTIDHILIETSGLALPKPLVQAFNWPEVKQYCTVDAVLSVVDGAAVADGRMADDPQQVAAQRAADDNLTHTSSLAELLDDQLRCADLVIISKADLLTAPQLQAVQARVDAQVPAAVKTLTVAHGEVPLSLVLGLGCASEQQIDEHATHHDDHHQHGGHHEHAHENFDSVVVQFGEMATEAVLARVQALVAAHAVVRVKGFVAVPDKPMRQVIQGVGTRLEHYYDRPWRADEPRTSRLVFIGQSLPHAAIQAAFATAGG